MKVKEIQLSHGSGGQEMNDLLGRLFYKHFANDILLKAEDAAMLQMDGPIAFTTDSFTVSPLFFPGGNIGKLAIAGTVNDLAMAGAQPEYLSSSFVIEEGFSIEQLTTIVESMAKELEKSGAKIVCGDTKVVPHGTLDGVIINTSGVGSVRYTGLSASNVQPDDAILVSRNMGSHGSCILMARDELKLESDLISDCDTLWPQVKALVEAGVELHSLRDATRGGLAAVLNEWTAASKVGIHVQEKDIPILDEVHGLCELYGFEPCDLANEGTMILAVPAGETEKALAVLREFHSDAACIGVAVAADKHRVTLTTPWGSRRYLDMPRGELLPRIC